MTIDLELQIAVEPTDTPLPSQEDFERWVTLVLASTGERIREEALELCIRIVSEEESRALNNQYREKDKPTNVLSFPADLPPGIPSALLGDLVICQTIVEKEALEQNKALKAHWAHMVVHGTLHLLGYDHETDLEAEEMEALEVELLTSAGFPNPYGGM